MKDKQKQASLLDEDVWRNWLSQAPTQRFFGAVAEKKREMEQRAGEGRWTNPKSAEETLFENGVGLGYLRAIRMLIEDILPPSIAEEMPEWTEGLRGKSAAPNLPTETWLRRDASGYYMECEYNKKTLLQRIRDARKCLSIKPWTIRVELGDEQTAKRHILNLQRALAWLASKP